MSTMDTKSPRDVNGPIIRKVSVDELKELYPLVDPGGKDFSVITIPLEDYEQLRKELDELVVKYGESLNERQSLVEISNEFKAQRDEAIEVLKNTLKANQEYLSEGFGACNSNGEFRRNANVANDIAQEFLKKIMEGEK